MKTFFVLILFTFSLGSLADTFDSCGDFGVAVGVGSDHDGVVVGRKDCRVAIKKAELKFISDRLSLLRSCRKLGGTMKCEKAERDVDASGAPMCLSRRMGHIKFYSHTISQGCRCICPQPNPDPNPSPYVEGKSYYEVEGKGGNCLQAAQHARILGRDSDSHMNNKQIPDRKLILDRAGRIVTDPRSIQNNTCPQDQNGAKTYSMGIQYTWKYHVQECQAVEVNRQNSRQIR